MGRRGWRYEKRGKGFEWLSSIGRLNGIQNAVELPGSIQGPLGISFKHLK